jgi:protein-serine/threonine kinase
MAPEIIKKVPYSGYLSDMWALGVILYTLLAGKLPFAHKNEKDLFTRI